jgi:CO/xanthine dehydrogenase Mo-binding subunit
MMTETVIGAPVPALQNEQLLSGKAQYLNDLKLPGMLVGKLLYSEHPCARIIDLDVETARSIPGVAAVLTHQDIPGENSYFYHDADQPLLASDRVNYVGDAIVAVAAVDEDTALAALEAVEVTYEPLPGIFDPLEAMKPDAVEALPGYDNIIQHTEFDFGNIQAGFEDADVIVENTYFNPWIEHAPLETEGALSYLDIEGTLVVYASNQAPNRDRMQIARSLDIPEHRIRVVTPYVGGAFGAKDEAHVQIHAALLTLATGKPVRIVRTREESILTHVKRHPIIVHHKMGARSDGKLAAIKVEIIGDTGPYENAGRFILGFAAAMASGPYNIPNARIDSYSVRTNNPIGGAMRGFGAPQVCLAYEGQMDTLARELRIDPLELRLRNTVQSGQVVPSGGIIREAAAVEAGLLEVSRLAGWENRDSIERQPAPNLRRGWGLSSTWFVIGLGRGQDNSGILLEMATDGSVVLRTSAVDMGQGVHTALAVMAAENLGVDLDSVRVVGPDTDSALDSGPSVASRQTFVSGNAVLKAAAVIRQSLLETAADETGLPVDILSLHGGGLFAEGERLSLNIPELAAKATFANRPMHADGFYAMEFPQEFSERGNFFGVGPSAFGSQIAQVLVDIETGEITIEKIVAVQNVGRIINYGGAYGQLVGACTMGTGNAITEELIVDQGRISNDSLESYLIPTAIDAPETVTKLLEIPEPYGPHGAVGIGEPSLTSTAPALLNAVSDAIGVRINQIPMTPERVLAAIEGDQEGK